MVKSIEESRSTRIVELSARWSMLDSDLNDYPEALLEAEFDRLFPRGFAGSDVVRELAPSGWENSPLRAVFHPSVEQVYQETVRIHRNLGMLRRPDDPRPVPPEPTIEEIARDFRDVPLEAEREIGELVGMCLWDVFSDSHEVVDRDARVLDLGSFRGSGGFLADALNRQTGVRKYDYMDFYMGTSWVAGRADLGAVYRLIFYRLQSRGLDWVYHFPRIHLVDFRPLKKALDESREPEWAGYCPSDSLAKEAEDAKRDREIAEARQALEEGYWEEVEEALKGPPPSTVIAYEAVYGRFPRGWPPRVRSEDDG
jgi:hypothetical protein